MKTFLFFIVLIAVISLIVWLSTREDEIDEIVRERIDYDVWLRRHNLTEEKEKGKK
jgi:hypothetical protein